MLFVQHQANPKKRVITKRTNISQESNLSWNLGTINRAKAHGNGIFFFKKASPLFKHAIFHLILIMIIEFTGIYMPMTAVQAVEKEDAKVIMPNGAVLNELESRLLKKDLVIKTPEVIVAKDGTIIHVINNGDVSILAKPLSLLPTVNDLGEYKVVNAGIHTLTAYNSEAYQTDASPCTTANMFDVCEHGVEDTIAANFLRFGTKVRIPDLFGDRIFIVRDRMNKRYPNRVDVWMINKDDALKFGTRRAQIEIISEL